ncbi:DNA-deoxyinosine glycosylase [Methanoregula sp.]|uniref:DNA-deoxyinosine glycosylase n=1 Tax=Methanoregula sp. TaxID=2052170 RepID=UPI002C8B6D1C|nr:DNA-deoxyinosine glycosylase [Methanoregula sp.]HVP97517.1 DNA-deoxyinosine glycosylase [Methanoregula sp.]
MTQPAPGLSPVTGRDPEVLILGSFPSRMSLEKGEYYGNPKNQFWKIMEQLFGIDPDLPYAARTALLAEHRIALWDVLCSCRREGSMDTAIRDPVPNDIRGFIAAHPTIRCIALNGGTAGRYFNRLNPGLPGLVLPSTSPAYAGMPLAEKIRHWARICPRSTV